MSAIHRAIGIPGDGLVRHLLGEEDEKTVDAHSRRYEPLRENMKPFPKTADLLRACAGRGLAVVLATRGQESDLEWIPVLTVSAAPPPACARRSGSSPSTPRSGRG